MKLIFGFLLVFINLFSVSNSYAQSRDELIADSKSALEKLIVSDRTAAQVSKKALAALVFPKIIKAGLFIGGQYGEGVLWIKGRPTAFYNTAGASLGLQIGSQQYGYALFFMNQKALDELDATNGFELGVGPTLVVVDEGMGKSHTNITLNADIDAFVFNQSGLMAGTGIQGNKITKLDQ